MQVAIVRPEEPAPAHADVCVVVDVLRATTTATVLCHRLGELCVIRSPAELGELPPRPAGYALFSELTGIEADLPRFDNSPVLARDAELAGRTPVLVTTNGTVAVGLAARFARQILLGSFVNAAAVVDHVRQSGAASVVVMPAGNIKKAERCIEDEGCAQTIAAALRGEAIEATALIAACRGDARILRRTAKEPGLAADLDLCLSLDAVPVVPCVVPGPDGRWFAVTAV